MSELVNEAAAQEELHEQRRVRREKLAELQAAGHDPFQITTYDVTHTAKQIRDHYDELEGKEVSLAGRMMSRRKMGKASFVDLRDHGVFPLPVVHPERVDGDPAPEIDVLFPVFRTERRPVPVIDLGGKTIVSCGDKFTVFFF